MENELQDILIPKDRWHGMAKRVLSLFMVFVMLLEFLPMTAWAAWDDKNTISCVFLQKTLVKSTKT